MSKTSQTDPSPSTLANDDRPGHEQRTMIAQDCTDQSNKHNMAESSTPLSSQNGDASGARPKKPDILYGLSLQEHGKSDRIFYKDESWKGVTTGLSSSEVDDFDEDNAVLGLVVEVDILDKTGKPGNSLATWRDQPVDFEFGRDAMVLEIRAPRIDFHSRRLVDVMEQMMDYYPEKHGNFRHCNAVLGTCYVDIMHFYAEMKAYHSLYLKSIPMDDSTLRKSPEFSRISDIGDCGDSKIADRISRQLTFGTLDISKPCDMATAYDIAVLLRQFAPMYRTRAIPTLELLHLNNDPSIKYDNIWLLYKPGTFVYVKEEGHLLACVIESARYLTKRHSDEFAPEAAVDRTKLSIWHLYSDGINFGRRSKRIYIPRFDGSRLVKDLEAVPCELYDKFDIGRRRAALKIRGRKYLELIKERTAYREYEDRGLGYDGYVIVDAASYNQHHSDAHQEMLVAMLQWVNTTSLASYAANEVRESIARESRSQLTSSDFLIADGGGGARFHDITKIDLNNYETHRLIEDIYLLLPPTIGGFLLKTKSWMNFFVDHISNHPPIRKPNQLENELVLLNDEDKESLRTVLPKGEKPIGILSDLIKDKGEGKVFLLHGPPGTGKTMTVECVANDTRRPLLALTAADIGLKEDSEATLRTWFTLAAKWDAILLIDEADLFLERRREGDIDRNSLVTVFLRTMEYYQGVLFLTTNRAGHIDDSFISRITVPIQYPSLQPETRKLIIEKLVRKLQETGTILVDPKAKQYLIDNCGKLNGRQLRNTLHNAVSIAEVQERRLQPQNIRDFIKVERHHVVSAIGRSVGFINYVDNMGGRDEFARAKKRGDYSVETIANID